MFRKFLFLFCTVTIALSACGTPGISDNIPTPLLTPPVPLTSWQVYQNTRYGFSIEYPPDATILVTDDEHARINLAIAPWTNLSRKYVEITVTPEASSCPSQYGALQSSETITLRDMAFLHEIGSGVATGNFYDWESYSTTKNSVCVNLTFMLHSVDVGNYATPPEQFAQFDKPEEAKVFPRIFSTFTW